MKKLGLGLVFSLAVSLLPISLPLHAATLTVNRLTDEADATGCELRAAILSIENGSPFPLCINSGAPYGTDDSIVFDPAIGGEVILLHDTLPIDHSMTINALPVSITVDGNGSRIFDIGNLLQPIVVNIAGLNITGGIAIPLDTGGGILLTGDDTLNLTDSAVYNNAAPLDSGGGIYVIAGALNLSNVTVSGNAALYNGGGIYISNGSLTANNVTITHNRAGSIGGGLYISHFSDATATLDNMILANNVAEGSGESIIANDCSAINVIANYSLIQDVTDCVITGSNNVISSDANLGPLQDNGGTTLTHVLLTGSPALDAGNPAAPGSPPACSPADQRGVERPQNLLCDMGAAEFDALISDLSILQTATPTSAIVGDPVAFDFIVTNSGPDAVLHARLLHAFDGPVLIDTLPSFCSEVPVSLPVTVVECAMDSLPSGGEQSYQILGSVTAEGQVDSLALIRDENRVASDPTPDNNASVASVLIGAPATFADLQVTQDVSQAAPAVGDTVELTFNLGNSGPDSANNVFSTHVLSGPFSLEGASLPGTCDAPVVEGEETIIQCDSGSLANGGSLSYSFTGQVTGTAPILSLVSVSDVDTGGGVSSDPDTVDNSATADFQGSAIDNVLKADLSLTSTASPAKAAVGQSVTFTITVQNSGPNPATAVRLTQFIVGDPNTFNVTEVSTGCSGTGPTPLTILCDLGPVSDTPVTVTVTGTVSATGEILNSADVTDLGGTVDPVTSNNSAKAITNEKAASTGGCSLNP